METIFAFFSVMQSLVAKQKSPLRERDDLVLICSAQGSSETTFSWYKNGFLLNISRSIRLVLEFLRIYSIAKRAFIVVINVAPGKSRMLRAQMYRGENFRVATNYSQGFGIAREKGEN